jgi:Putative zinc-finger
MNPRSGMCDDVAPLLPELALGTADGDERARALEHIAGCSDCRRELADLSIVVDDLIALAPEREPPLGFESRVLARLTPTQAPAPTARPRPRRLRFAAAVLAGAAAAAVALVIAYGPDHRLADQYRAALQGGQGRYFQSARLRAPDGSEVGKVFAYEGSPSWLFYVLDGRDSAGTYREQLVMRGGRIVTLPPFRLVSGSWGVTIPVALHDVATVRLARAPGGRTLEAELPVVEP